MISHCNPIVLIVVFLFPFSIKGVISDFRKHMLLELQSQSLIPVSSATYCIEKSSYQYYADDYVNNYYIGRALSAPDTWNFAELKFFCQIRKTNVKRFEWSNHDDIDHGNSSWVLYGPST